MFTTKALFALLAGLAAAQPAAYQPTYYTGDCDDYVVPTGCGEVNVFLTGLPPNHPLVAAQGYNTTLVDLSLRRDAANIIAAGYNLKFLLYGPEVSNDLLRQELQGVEWHGVGVGFGVRGAPRPDLTVRFEEELQVYREEEPQAKFFFNYSPTTSLWAIQRNFPLAENCTNHPGKILGYVTKCDIC